MRTRVWAMFSGLVAGVLGLVVSEVVSLLLVPQASPVSAIGSLLIDLAPPFAKDAMIAAFGTADKTVLVAALIVVGMVLAAVAGVVELRRRLAGVGLVVLAAIVGGIALATRTGSDALWFVPLGAGGIVGGWVLHALVARLRSAADTDAEAGAAEGSAAARASRRTFLRGTAIAGALAVVGAVGAGLGRSAAGAAQAVRDRIRLPTPASRAAAVPAGADLDVPGLASYVTPSADFYRIDTAIVVPRVDPASWRLRIHGLVDHEVELGFDDLLKLPLVERYVTLTCVSNEVGGDLVGNARWLGYPVRKLLERAAPTSRADMVLSTSTDGFTAGTPLSVMQDPHRDALVAVGMNGGPLPYEHGFPARLVVPGLYGYVSATKWVTDLELTRFDQASAYWTDRGWSEKGPIKTESRIDVPRDGTTVKAGATIAGVAWAQHTGIARVEVRVDGDAWRDATLAEVVSVDTWVQWRIPLAASSGQHRIQVRATDRAGYTQTASIRGTVPNGATGYDTIHVTVAS